MRLIARCLRYRYLLDGRRLFCCRGRERRRCWPHVEAGWLEVFANKARLDGRHQRARSQKRVARILYELARTERLY
ncbi:MAG: hypothetical protein JNM56_29010 [Planctomycetia bacterium]|nr:hypothetical protein [Planctomycetia bacterium]